MPILGAASTASGVDPTVLLIPAAISASCAFMLPVATMPNAVVYGTGEFSIKRMAREGFVLNLIGTLVVTTICYLALSQNLTQLKKKPNFNQKLDPTVNRH